MPIKQNRKVSLSLADKNKVKYFKVDKLKINKNAELLIYQEGVPFPVKVIKPIYKNDDGTEGILYLISNDLTLTAKIMVAIYQKRWKVEEYHKSLKQNVSQCKSPTKVVRDQKNHNFAAIYAFCKFECINLLAKMSSTAL